MYYLHYIPNCSNYDKLVVENELEDFIIHQCYNNIIIHTI